MIRIGLISDTHAVLPQQVHELFSRVDYILHAGDIGSREILWELEGIAPVFAVLGNNDWSDYGPGVRGHCTPYLAGCHIYLTHYPHEAEAAARTGKYELAIHGHTHRPRDEVLNGCRILNPGSTTRPRGGTPHSVMIVELEQGVCHKVRLLKIAKAGIL